jgi:hypothetical protein
VKKSFNIQELLHRTSKHHGTKPMHPSLSRGFQGDQEHDLKHPGLVDLTVTNKTKQTNNLPSYINNALHSWSDTTKDIEKSFTM